MKLKLGNISYDTVASATTPRIKIGSQYIQLTTNINEAVAKPRLLIAGNSGVKYYVKKQATHKITAKYNTYIKETRHLKHNGTDSHPGYIDEYWDLYSQRIIININGNIHNFVDGTNGYFAWPAFVNFCQENENIEIVENTSSIEYMNNEHKIYCYDAYVWSMKGSYARVVPSYTYPARENSNTLYISTDQNIIIPENQNINGIIIEKLY